MGTSCSKICHYHQRSNSSTTLVVASDSPETGKLPTAAEIALVTTTFTEENADEHIGLELQDSDQGFQALWKVLTEDNAGNFQTAFEQAEEVREEDVFRLLLGACIANQTDSAKMLIGKVKTVNTFSYPFENPLLLAIKHKNIEIVMALIEAGAELNPTLHSDSATALFSPVLAAVRAGDKDVLKLLVDMGGDLTLTDGDLTVLQLADPRNEDLMDYLISEYTVAIVTKRLKVGRTEGLEEELMKLEPGLRISQSGLTPFLVGCRLGLDRLTLHCLQQRPEVLNSQDDYGMTGLMYAAMGKHASICRTLCAWKAALTLRTKWGKTALHFAGETGEMEVMEALSPSPELLNVKTDLGETALDYASLAYSYT